MPYTGGSANTALVNNVWTSYWVCFSMWHCINYVVCLEAICIDSWTVAYRL